MVWRALCNSEAVNEFPVCLWNEREHSLVHLVPSKYFSKARHKEIIICHSTLMPLSPPPACLDKNSGSQCRESTHTEGPVYIEMPAVFLVPLKAVYKVCHCVLSPKGSTGLRHGTSGPPCPPRSLLLPGPLQLQPSISLQEGCVSPSVWRYN